MAYKIYIKHVKHPLFSCNKLTIAALLSSLNTVSFRYNSEPFGTGRQTVP